MSRGRRIAGVALVAGLLGAGQLATPQRTPVAAQAAEQCFTETPQCITEPFLTYWNEHGGLAINGYPLTGVFKEQIGQQTYTVQYFERSRLEIHTENTPPNDILLGQFGRVLYATDPFNPRATAVPARTGARYFEETGHNLDGLFRAFWEANGGIPQFGVPISEPLRERLEDNQEHEVQYFERARLELHTDEKTGLPIVLLGQFGRRILAASVPNAPLPYLVSDRRGQLYRNNADVRARLGVPTSAESPSQGVVQSFERGVMIYRADTRTIYVAVRDQGGVPQLGGWRSYADTWGEEQAVGGGPAPVPNLWYPKRGFGKLWRANADLQQLLGYATTPDEGIKDLVIQPFKGGLIVDNFDRADAPYYAVPAGVFAFYTNGRYEYQYPVYYP